LIFCRVATRWSALEALEAVVCSSTVTKLSSYQVAKSDGGMALSAALPPLCAAARRRGVNSWPSGTEDCAAQCAEAWPQR
jgi:hypothetical protein